MSLTTQEEKNQPMGELYVFPLLKRYPLKKGKTDLESLPREDLEKFAYHYMRQIVEKIENHGFTLDKKFYQDFDLVHQAFLSTVLRSCGKYHPLQQYVDELSDVAATKKTKKEVVEETPTTK